MKVINQKKNNVDSFLKNLIDSRSKELLGDIDSNVSNIINKVKTYGNDALIDFTYKYDNSKINKDEILIPDKIKKNYTNKINKKIIISFEKAIENITQYHKKQLPTNYELNNNNFVTGSKWLPIESVGLYVPGGTASYPSSLIMNVIPAKIAGVKRIVVTTPMKNNEINPYILAILDMLGIEEVYRIGGAHAIAALAYGTETIEPVCKIFGPGNIYVTSAKKQVFGKVGIDLIAGPSEIVVVADKNNNSDWVASDLIAQAEHDENSQCILITDDEDFAFKVKNSIENLSSKLLRYDSIKKSINNKGAIIILNCIENASEIINKIAPEHLHLHIKNCEKIFEKVNNAGCVFLGEYSSEVFGDYIVGTNHILPTSGSARFSSGLGVLDFMKRSSYVRMNKKSFDDLSDKASDMASIEGLDGHKMSVTIRQNEKK